MESKIQDCLGFSYLGSLHNAAVACVASISVGFGAKKEGFDSLSSFFGPKPHGNACYASCTAATFVTARAHHGSLRSTALIHMIMSSGRIIMSSGRILLVRSYNDRWLDLDSISVGNTGLKPLATRRKQQTLWSSHQRSSASSDCAILLLLF